MIGYDLACRKLRSNSIQMTSGNKLKHQVSQHFCHSTKTPCIMCVQYIRGCSVHRGVFSTLEGYHEYIGGYHEYIGGCSVHRGDIMMHVGDIMSTSGDVQYIGGIP